MDDTRYFAHPDRYNADILWFSKGFVEYEIPNFIPGSQKITQILISAELSSEAPGINNVWPSDISFYLMMSASAPGHPQEISEMSAVFSLQTGGSELEPVWIVKNACDQ